MAQQKTGGIPLPCAREGGELKKARLTKGLKQREVASALGHSEGHVGRYQNWERGANRPDPAEFGPLSALLGIEVASLYTKTPETHVPQSLRRHVVDAKAVRPLLASIRRDLEALEQLVRPLASEASEIKYSKAERKKKDKVSVP